MNESLLCREKGFTKLLLGLSMAGVLTPSVLTILIHLWKYEEYRPLILLYSSFSGLCIMGLIAVFEQYCKHRGG